MDQNICPRDQLIKDLRAIGACDDALNWLATLPPETTLQGAWNQCADGDWLEWLVDNCTEETCASSDPDEIRKFYKCPEKIPTACPGGCERPEEYCTCDDDFDDDDFEDEDDFDDEDFEDDEEDDDFEDDDDFDDEDEEDEFEDD